MQLVNFSKLGSYILKKEKDGLYCLYGNIQSASRISDLNLIFQLSAINYAFEL